MPRPQEIIAQNKEGKAYLLKISTGSRFKECMKILGYEDSDDILGFVNYIFTDNKFLEFCERYIAEFKREGIARMSGEDWYYLSFVEFIEIRYNEECENISFRACDYHPHDYRITRKGGGLSFEAIKRILKSKESGLIIMRGNVKVRKGIPVVMFKGNSTRLAPANSVRKYIENLLIPAICSKMDSLLVVVHYLREKKILKKEKSRRSSY